MFWNISIYPNVGSLGFKMYSLPVVKYFNSFQYLFKHNIMNTLTTSTIILIETKFYKSVCMYKDILYNN